MGIAPLLLRPAPFAGAALLLPEPHLTAARDLSFLFADVRLVPHYPSPSPLADVLRLVPPGSDAYLTEQYASEIAALFGEWSLSLRTSPRNLGPLSRFLDAGLKACSLTSPAEIPLRSGYGVDAVRRRYPAAAFAGRDRFLDEIGSWLAPFIRIETAEFEIYGIEQTAASLLTLRLDIRYDIVATRTDSRREERVGSWHTVWFRDPSNSWRAQHWEFGEETATQVRGPIFTDVTSHAMAEAPSYAAQLLPGVDHWRTLLDGACGIDLYSNTGIAAADFDNDGYDDIYVCQPAGLPNRLYRNRGGGTFEDVTERAGVGVLDNTACALFADFRNRGLQDLLVVCGTGPLLFLNQGDGTFAHKPGAFRFGRAPEGSFTHAALADYDRDGRLDVYLCTYMYYLGLDQYHYPVPYYDARNGPPNCLFHNQGDGTFVETTEAAGLNADNNRYSFAAAWGDSRSSGLPDLFVVNDFGSSQLYRNNGDGTFTVASKDAHVEDVGAGMSCCWADFDNDGHQDVYVPSMWEAAGQRVSEQQQFHSEAPANIRALYQRHARGNALYRNNGDGTFRNIGRQAGVDMGRWSWCSDFFDFDHDGYSDLYVANGYISSLDRNDLASFFWRQVVAQSPDDATSSTGYERGWNAINELIRSDHTWHGYARNVFFANNRNGTFSEISGPAGLDFIDDSRSFALADIDQDGRLEIILKNRNAPQLRILHNSMPEIGGSIALRLRGTKSNRDAIGASVTLEAGPLRQTKYLQAGSGFLAQHSKELFFGTGDVAANIRATVRWPSGLSQHFENLPFNHRIEIEEGSTNFSAKPFASSPAAWADAAPPATPTPLPTQAATWLIEPLRAPDFSLPALDGSTRSLTQSHGRFVLLHFWTASAPLCRKQLGLLNQSRAAFAVRQLDILALNLDDPESQTAVRSLATEELLTFPVLLTTPEIAGIYNIIYRYLFDRRRDLGIPTSFLVDSESIIVRVYQGMVDPAQILTDLGSVPSTPAERTLQALPFPGKLYQGSFQRNDFTYGVALFQHGYLDEADASFRQVIATNPNDGEAYYNLGTLALRRKNLAQAQEYLQQSLRLRPNYPEAWNNLGMIAAQQGRPDKAIDDFQHSLVLRPTYAIALLNLGNVYRRERDFARAEDCLTRALALDPADAEINYSFGMLCAQQSQMDRASEYLHKAIALRPDYPEALNNLGVLFVHMQDFARAEAQFRTCIRLVPAFDQSYLNLANLYAMESNREQAKEVLEELLRIQPTNPNAREALEMLQ